MAKIINLTPHEIIIVNEGCPSKVADRTELQQYVIDRFPPSGLVARVKADRVKIGEYNGIPVFKTVFGGVEGLPAPERGVIYIVSTLVLQALKGKRNDVVAPDTSPQSAVRDESGKIIAVKGFQVI